MAKLNNITGALLIDATATFLNGAGLGVQEDKNRIIPKTYKERVNNRIEDVPYVSAQSWRRWLRDTANEENNWNPSELRAVGEGSEKGTTNKIATELNPIEFPEDDLFGYMKAGAKGEESVQRTSPFKSSILKGIKNMRTINIDEAFVHLKEGTPLPYSTKFYSAHLEGFFNLEYYRLGVYDNLGSKQELSSELLNKHVDKLEQSSLGGKFFRYKLKNASENRNNNAAGLLKGLAYLRGGAKQAAFGADVSPKVLILAGLESANPIFNNLFIGTGERPILNTELLLELAADYNEKLATPIYVGFRKGYLQNEEEVTEKLNNGFVLGSPIEIVNQFNKNHLTNG
ncbi:CRISPR-associated Cst2 family autoregulator [Sphingobacterium allocomposti]|uniref:CRISPR-associated Cst2 family autoregulator n=1 Tax=Sphingobacterium allocomposti TaxID=415956 RepID=A0A5S5CYU7_9SPHI|nr:type I-B CRISPR-associated protein Cas7/Cst2/DevR [Sphingobacterium composti Yoo et al. 2007 non Ten et al. 2007]TYP87742.1 CRISPR-associated Cst2 family autoregulator [Sphingobacterium composti Yoo et al. 2007 non Ten et al. 2007]